MNDSNGTERRREPRRRTLKAGRLLIDKKAVLNCTIRNLSQHGGRLDITSAPGGTTVLLTFPAARIGAARQGAPGLPSCPSWEAA